MSVLAMIAQRPGRDDAALWVREGDERLPGRDDNRRLERVREGLSRHPDVRSGAADVDDAALERTLGALHEPGYVDALLGVRNGDPVVLAEFAPPGLEPDIPVNAGLVAAAREAVRTAIAAAERLAAGRRFAYAVCRPPGHHAGPDWMAGYCYLNSPAAAVQTLREAGLGPVGVIDLDLHYPNGTSALVERMPDATLHSLHAAPVTNLPPGAVLPRVDGERTVAFEAPPGAEEYLAEVAISLGILAAQSRSLVVSLGFDTVAGDPHGGWDLPISVFTEIGAMLAATGLPICTVQEGGYALEVLADCAHAYATGLLAAPAPNSQGRSLLVAQRATSDERNAEGVVR